MNIDIVFVHTDSPLPSHLLFNLFRTRRYLPNHRVCLIYNRRSILSFFWRDKVYLKFDDDDNKVNEMYGYPKDFRHNFWFSSVGRFSLLAKYQSSINRSVLHIESDVIISRDFPIEEFQKIETPFAYSIVSDNRAVASILFLKDAHSSHSLWEFSKEKIKSNSLSSDMEILHDLWRETPKNVSVLPTAPKSLLRHKNELEQNNHIFSGFFDGNDFGVFVVGTNPWNRRGVSILHSRIEGSLLSFRENDVFYDKARRFPSIRDKDAYGKLYSFHITNKNPLFFVSQFSSIFLQLWIERLQKQNKTFHPIVYLLMLYRSLVRRIFMIPKALQKYKS